MDSNGNVGTNHKYYRESHDKLAKAQCKLSRMQGSKKHEDKSNNYMKQLRNKLSDRNKYLVKVDKWFSSSQICHCCGALHPEMKDLSNRTMVCDCVLTINRDKNAAYQYPK